MLDFALLKLLRSGTGQPACPTLPKNDKRFLGLARLAALLAAVEFVLRALLRARGDWLSDLAAPYTSARFWLAGANPYNPFTFLEKWEASGAPRLGLSDFVSGTHSVYPPPTLLLMAPLALLQWSTAVHLFVLVGVVLYFASIYAMIRIAWPQHCHLADIASDRLPLFFIAFALAFAPVHTAFHSLNIVLLAASAAMLAVAVSICIGETDGSKSGISKGAVFLGIGVTAAILIKPTTGVFLLPWLVRERRWHVIATVFAVCAVLTVLSLEPLIAHQGTAWLTDYRQNVSALFTHGGNADVSAENTQNTDRIDLQLIGFALLGDRTLASAFAALVYLALLFVFLKRAGWGSNSAGSCDLPLLVAAGCLALGLLPSYTRVYAAIVLLPLALWCLTHFRFSSARWIMLLLLDFLINSSALVRKLGEVAGAISRAPRLWDFTIGGHTCWLLIAIGLLLPLAVRQQIADAAPSQ